MCPLSATVSLLGIKVMGLVGIMPLAMGRVEYCMKLCAGNRVSPHLRLSPPGTRGRLKTYADEGLSTRSSVGSINTL